MIAYEHKWSRIKTTAMWSMILLIIGFGVYFSSLRKAGSQVKSLQVIIDSPNKDRTLISEEEITRKLMIYLGYDVIHATIQDINLMEIEDLIHQDERIDRAEVYLDSRNNLVIRIWEKLIIGRVQSSESSYYLDIHGNKVPVTNGRAVRVPVITGYTGLYSLAQIESDERNNLKDVYEVARKLMDDAFLSALIEQIEIDQDGRITLIPKIGRERITLYAGDLDEKFFKLKYMYKDGLPKEGWNKYSTLNLDFENQVVAELRNSN
ncbi:MAG TPA: hypothetical protein PKC30_01400 [Saprospiraceae bacterium]|nr:hypothetical protein [Saprospiraceae bacterium]